MDLQEKESETNKLSDEGITLVLTGGPMAPNSKVEIKEIPLSKIKLSKNSRLTVSDDDIAGLMQSIKKTGLLQPIGVFKSKTGNGYEINYGNRRYLACSKLGMTKIPAIVHANKSDAENDLKNLTENLQRRNITLTEAGRYIDLLKKDGLSSAEIGVRLGVSKGYVDTCLDAFIKVPVEFRGDLDVRTTSDKRRTPGKIAIHTARAIISSSKSYALTPKQQSILYKAAKSEDKFNPKSVNKYAEAVIHGSKDPVNEVSSMKRMQINCWIDEKEYERLYKKHVTNGPFKSVTGFCIAVLRGEKAEHLKIRA